MQCGDNGVNGLFVPRLVYKEFRHVNGNATILWQLLEAVTVSEMEQKLRLVSLLPAVIVRAFATQKLIIS